MNHEPPRKIVKISSKGNKAAEEKKASSGGLHFGDYRPRYTAAFDIYEKAKTHARQQRKRQK